MATGSWPKKSENLENFRRAASFASEIGRTWLVLSPEPRRITRNTENAVKVGVLGYGRKIRPKIMKKSENLENFRRAASFASEIGRTWLVLSPEPRRMTRNTENAVKVGVLGYGRKIRPKIIENDPKPRKFSRSSKFRE